ncbi:MAG: carbohydrate-binding protein [Catenulispora sp.]|nr:carbohydrate-binding protein [Catenulispora sp.]
MPGNGNRPLRALIAVAGATALSAALVVFTQHGASADPLAPHASGWTSVFHDDFNGSAGSSPSSANWLYDLGTSYPGGAGNWGTGEVETDTASTANVYLDGSGDLAIKAIRDANGAWTSGRIETQRTDFQPPAGGVLRMQARIQMPNVTGDAAAGYWPAFWSMGAPARPVGATNWPSIGEIDVMENVQGQNLEYGTLHCGVDPGGPCNETTGIGNHTPCVTGGTCQAAFHTYAVEWDTSTSPQQLRWYLDGVQFHQVSSDQVDATTWADATNHGYFLILDVAMGGAFPGAFGGGPTAATASGVPMLVDYVDVSTESGGSTTPPTTAPTTPPTTTPTTPPTTTPTTPPTTPTTSPTTPPTSPTSSGGTGGGAYSPIQAANYTGQSGATTEPCTDTGGGLDVAQLKNGNWLSFTDVDFGATPATQFYGRVASGAAGGISGLVEVRLDSPTAPVIGSFAIADTGGWQSWRTVPANMSAVTGVHTVYLTFTSGQPASYVSVHWFDFGH